MTAKKAGYALHPSAAGKLKGDARAGADRWAMPQEHRQKVAGRACGKRLIPALEQFSFPHNLQQHLIHPSCSLRCKNMVFELGE